jgi:hypothetical protein
MKRDGKGKRVKVAPTSAQPKRPSDPNQFAHALIQEMTDRLENPATPEKPTETPVSVSDISRVMAELGRRGGKIGGKKRMETLSQDRRSQIAFKAAQARWAKKKKA